MNTDAESFLPLRPATFYILAALSQQERHGYGIMQFAQRESEGGVRLGPGTLYGALKRLLADGLVEEAGEQADPELDERRRYYRITPLGRAVARAEARRMSDAVRLATMVKLLRPNTT